MTGKVVAVSVSKNKGERKSPVARVELRENHGIAGDAHAGDWHRQVSLLAVESIRSMRALGLEVEAGDFAENITTEGINLPVLPVGTILELGETVLEVTQIGKECHTRCAIFHQAGDCVMPKEGIFARVLKGGSVRPGDTIVIRGAAQRTGERAAAAEKPKGKPRYNVVSMRVDDGEMEYFQNLMRTTNRKSSDLMRDAFKLFLERWTLSGAVSE
jgi:MOSC domain-containing protein YiiM